MKIEDTNEIKMLHEVINEYKKENEELKNVNKLYNKDIHYKQDKINNLEGKFIHERDENRRISLIDLKSIHYEKMKKENEKLKEENKKLSETILKWQEKADFNMDELYQDCLPDVWDQM